MVLSHGNERNDRPGLFKYQDIEIVFPHEI